MNILVKPVTEEDEARWHQVIAEDVAANSGRRRGAYAEDIETSSVSPSNPSGATYHSVNELHHMSYTAIKQIALENIQRLERIGKVTRKNHFQDLLNAIAMDIRTKHRRRNQRAKELEGVKQTLAHLGEKSKFLDDQLKSYNDYVEQAMLTLQTKKGKKKIILPFTKQYFHEKELQKSGRVPKFGSYKYSSRELAQKGVLVGLEGALAGGMGEKISFTFSSDEVGVFHVEVSQGAMMVPGGSMDVNLDDLLQVSLKKKPYEFRIIGELVG